MDQIMKDLGPILVPLVVALIALIPSYLAARSSSKLKAEIQQRRQRDDATRIVEQVYGTAYDRAQRINQEIVAGLRDEVQRLRAELAELRHQISTSASRRQELERHVASLERTVDRMSNLLTQQGIDPPADHG